MKTRDIDIRTSLHEKLNKKYSNDPSTLIVDELCLCQGDARIDIAVVNGKMHGFEIKSESDTLDRLPSQIEVYNKVMDTVTIVAGINHIDKIINTVPEWWGISIAAKDKNGNLKIKVLRKPKKNKEIDPYSVAQLLWKEEALDILHFKKMDKGFKSKPRRVLWERLSSNLPLNELQLIVREKIKNRKNWRVGQ